jgi:hypothetical protein
MTFLGRRRPPDDRHSRARFLAALRVDESLEADDARWLDDHLAECPDCTAGAGDYEANRALLRASPLPVPPRDLWARTAGRLDHETARATRRRWPTLRRVPAGALAGALVIAVVVGAASLERGILPIGRGPVASGASSGAAVGPSAPGADAPLALAREVRLLRPGIDGTLGLLTATVDEVCTAARSGDCRAETNGSGAQIRVRQRPKSVVQSPKGDELAVVVSDSNGGSSVVIVSTATARPTDTATATPAPTATPTPAPTATPTPTPTATPTREPSRSPHANATATPPPSTTPTATPPPTSAASPTPSPVITSPSPAVGVPVAIASDLSLIGQDADYSPSGDWFAFSARPANGRQGPDIYVWHTGDAAARAVTDDHRSVFSAWVGENVLGSRAEPLTAAAGSEASLDAATIGDAAAPSDDAAGAPSGEAPDLTGLVSTAGIEARSVSFLLDPVSGASRDLAGAGIWRPVVDPSGRYAVYWSGTIEVDANGVDWRPANGTLVLARWDPSVLVTPDSVAPSASDSAGTPAPTASAAASASPATAVALLASAPLGDWDARWDETGTHLALWIADVPSAELGRLTLHTVDLTSGTLDAGGALFSDQPAGPGYAIGEGRVAWVSPEDSASSVVKVYAWAGAKGGTAQTTTQPGDTLVVH